MSTSNKKNSVGQAVATLLVSLRKKREVIEQSYDEKKLTKEDLTAIAAYDEHATTTELKKVVWLNIKQEQYAVQNAETIINKIAVAVDWSGTADTLPERLKKVFSSCIMEQKKRPKILQELKITVRELELIGSMVDSLKSKSAINIVVVDI